MRRVTVGVDPAYDVVVGPDAVGELGSLVAGYRQVHVVSQRSVIDAVGERVLPAVRAGEAVPIALIGEGEPAKSLDTVGVLCRSFASAGLLRADVIVAIGGGVVGDTAGFAAAVYHRGIAVLHVATTLLAQIDSAVGGKTAVNLPEGKNLVGAIHQPVAVVADTSTLVSLSPRDFLSGLGEVAKYALMPEGESIVDLLRLRADRVLARDAGALADLVVACVEIKAAIVATDPEERTGARATLNYGHTFAHALETAGGYDLTHGEAVAIGLVFAVHLAGALGRVGPDVVDRVHGVVAGLGLPVRVPGGPTAEELLAIMRRDKKATGGLTFVLPGPNGLELVEDPPAPALDRAFRVVGVEA